MVQEFRNQIAQENLNHPLTYEQLMNRYRDWLTKLNISLCQECFIPIGLEEGEH
ncbi:43959_t:CDS:1, partial [Gigaspora margarita]